MHWRLWLFSTRRYRRPALVVVAALLVVLAIGGTWYRVTRQEYRLTIEVTDPEFVSAVEVRSTCCRPVGAAIGVTAPSATFVLQRGDYIVVATPSSAGYNQHWYFVPTAVHLDGDRTVNIQGSYGQG